MYGKLMEHGRECVLALVASKPSPVLGVTNDNGSISAGTIKAYPVLQPIPQQKIDRTSGKINQNTGY